MRAQARLLPDGRRLHLQDGPIDLVVEAVPFGLITSPRHAEERCAAARLEARGTGGASFEARLWLAPQSLPPRRRGMRSG